MGTKNNPGQYDCYAKADPDEPLFTLRAKDPSAPYLVQMWVSARAGNFKAMRGLVTTMSKDNDILNLVSLDTYDKLEEAGRCAGDMAKWREKWREEYELRKG